MEKAGQICGEIFFFLFLEKEIAHINILCIIQGYLSRKMRA